MRVRRAAARVAYAAVLRRLAAFVAVLLLVAGTACGALDAALDTEDALEAAGFRDPSVSWYSTDGVEYVTVDWWAEAELGDALEEESAALAGVVWREAPVYFDYVETNAMDAAGEYLEGGVREYPRAMLESRYGPRPAGLDRDIAELFNVRGFVTTLLTLLVVGGAVTTLIVALVVRSSRRRREQAPVAGWGPAPAWGAAGGASGAGPYAPPAPGGWPPGPPLAPPAHGGWPPGSWPPAPPPPAPGAWPS
ncbi:MAG TPA: hypothetical protein VNA20_18725, partial [Frankiaceae bacterium]|nr:hypothetical protein [Frankiaceae bacterium]